MALSAQQQVLTATPCKSITLRGHWCATTRNSIPLAQSTPTRICTYSKSQCAIMAHHVHRASWHRDRHRDPHCTQANNPCGPGKQGQAQYRSAKRSDRRP